MICYSRLSMVMIWPPSTPTPDLHHAEHEAVRLTIFIGEFLRVPVWESCGQSARLGRTGLQDKHMGGQFASYRRPASSSVEQKIPEQDDCHHIVARHHTLANTTTDGRYTHTVALKRSVEPRCARKVQRQAHTLNPLVLVPNGANEGLAGVLCHGARPGGPILHRRAADSPL